MFKTRLETFGNDFRHFCIFENFFDFLKTFRSLNPPWNTGQKNFSKKCTPKHVQNIFGHFCEQFWAFLGKFENCSTFRKHLEDSTLHGKLGKKNFGKIIPKHVQNTLGHFWNNFGHFWKIWKLFDFLKTFRRLDPPWKTRQKKIRKNYPKTCSKHVWTLLGTILGIYGILKIFDLLKAYRRLDPPWNTG